MAEVNESATPGDAAASETAPQQGPDSGRTATAVEVQQAELPEAVDKGTRVAGGQIDILLDTTMTVTVCLGEAQVIVRDLLQLGPGAVVKLDRRVGEPIDLYLSGVKFAIGHLVVVGEQLAVRIKEILTPAGPEEP